MKAFPESVFGPGTAVEVNLNSESWVPAVVLVEYGTNLVLVRYKKSADNGEEQVLVKQTVQLEQIRPQPPEIKNDKSFDLLEKVDAYCDSSWSVGLVTKILQERRYVVFFKLEEKVKEFNHSQLRPHLDWFDGQWVTNSGVGIPVFIYSFIIITTFLCLLLLFWKGAGDEIKLNDFLWFIFML